jgi:hypothetical protein
MSHNLEEINVFSYTFRFVCIGIHFKLGHQVAQLVKALRYKPIPDGVIWILHWHNTSYRTMALGSTQSRREMSTRIISCGGKVGRCVGLTTVPLSCADSHEFWEPQRPGTPKASSGQTDCLTSYFTLLKYPGVKWPKCMSVKSTHVKH